MDLQRRLAHQRCSVRLFWSALQLWQKQLHRQHILHRHTALSFGESAGRVLRPWRCDTVDGLADSATGDTANVPDRHRGPVARAAPKEQEGGRYWPRTCAGCNELIRSTWYNWSCSLTGAGIPPAPYRGRGEVEGRLTV